VVRPGPQRSSGSPIAAAILTSGALVADMVRHEAAELVHDAAAEHSGFRREPAALGVGEAQATAAELLAQDPVLLLEVLEDLALAAVHPACEHQEQEMKRRDRQARPSYT